MPEAVESRRASALSIHQTRSAAGQPKSLALLDADRERPKVMAVRHRRQEKPAAASHRLSTASKLSDQAVQLTERRASFAGVCAAANPPKLP